MIKKLFLWTVVIALLLVGLFFGIGYLAFNTEAFKDQIIAAMNNTTGRTFSVNGPYLLTWNPIPTMTLENVSLSNSEKSKNPQMLTADKVQIQIEWASLLSHPIKIKDITITNPAVIVERLNRQSTNLDFPKLFAPYVQEENMLDAGQASLKIEKVFIKNGTLTYVNNVSKQSYSFQKINGELLMNALNGPFNFKGEATTQNIPFKIEAFLSEHKNLQPIQVIANIESTVGTTALKLQGNIFPSDEEKYMSGDISLSIQKPNELLEKWNFPALKKENNLPFSASFAFEQTFQQNTLSEIVFVTGNPDEAAAGKTASGAGEWRSDIDGKESDITLEISHLNLSDWLETIQALATKKLSLTNTKTSFALTVKDITWKNTPVSSAFFSGIMEQNNLLLSKDSKITFSDKTTLDLNGNVKMENAQWQAGNLALNLKSENTQELAFLFPTKKPFLTEALQKITTANITGAYKWENTNYVWVVPEFKLNETGGSLLLKKQADQPIILEISVDKLDLNTYVPQMSAPLISIKKALEILNKTLSETILPAPLMHMAINATQTKWRETTLSEAVATINTTPATMETEIFVALPPQENCTLKAHIENVGTPNWYIKNITWETTGSNFQNILNLLGIEVQENWLYKSQNFFSQGEASGNNKSWNINGIYQIQQQENELTLQARGQLIENAPYNLAVALKHSKINQLLTDIWFENPFPNLSGTFNLETLLTKTEDTFTMDNLLAETEDQVFNGKAVYNAVDKDSRLTLTTPNLNAQKFLPEVHGFYSTTGGFNKQNLDMSFLKNQKGTLNLFAENLTYHNTSLNEAQITLHNEGTDLTAYLAAKGLEQNLEANLTLNWQNTPNFMLSLDVNHFKLQEPLLMIRNIGLSEGVLSTKGTLSATGNSAFEMAQNLSGNGSFEIQHTTWQTGDIALLSKTILQAKENGTEQKIYERKINQALDSNEIFVDKITGNFNIANGIWSAQNLNPKIQDATISNAEAVWDIPNQNINLSWALNLNNINMPPILFQFEKEKNGLDYITNTQELVTELARQINQEKETREKAAQAEKEKRLQEELENTKNAAFEKYQIFKETLTTLQQYINSTKNQQFQLKMEAIEATLQPLHQELLNPENNKQAFQKLMTDIEEYQIELISIQNILFKQEIEKLKQQSKELIQPATDFVGKINTLYKKRPHISLLMDLHKNAQKQTEIMERALNQFKKNLTLEQAKTVATVVQTAYNKINVAYDYAQQIYAGREILPTQNNISKADE